MVQNRLTQLRQLLMAEPDDAFLNHALAMEYLSMGEEDQAIQTMEKLLNTQPDHTGTYYHLGFAYLRKGDKKAALAIWEKGIQVCRELKKQHHLAELQSAYNELMFDEEDTF